MSLKKLMNNIGNDNVIKSLIDCIKCSFGVGECDNIECGDLKALADLAMMHAVDCVIYPTLQKKFQDNNEIMQILSERYNRAIMIDATQQYYLELLENTFEQNQIRYCVMKGPVIKKLYPSSEMRKSGDIDIFVDDKNTDKVKDLMTGLGFDVKTFNKAVAHDEYCIDRVIEVEIHRTLISNKCPWDKECQKITERLVVSDGHKFKYEMTKEDYYLYMIAHMAKHMRYSGIGIRMVLDVWVYLNAYGDVLDFDKINSRLEKCELLEFENNVRNLCAYWFDGKEASEKTIELGMYIAASGDFGTYEQLLSSEFARNAGKSKSTLKGKLRLYLGIYFMPYKHMKQKYPILSKMPILLPFFWTYRAVTGIVNDKEKAAGIINRYENVDIDKGKAIIDFKKRIGL